MEDRIEVLRDAVVAEMERLGFGEETVKRFKWDCGRFVEFSASRGTDRFYEDIGSEYLRQRYKYPNGKTLHSVTIGVRRAVWCIRRLGDMKQFGALVALKKRIPDYEWASHDRDLIQLFMQHYYQNPDRSENTRSSQEGRLKVFYRFLGFRKVTGVSEMTSQLISDYVKSLQGFATVYINTLLRTLKQYFALNPYLHIVDAKPLFHAVERAVS